MQTLEAMQSRIKGAENLYALVRVMKALSAVSIRQCQNAIESLSVYTRTIEMGLQIVLRRHPMIDAGGHRERTSPWGMLIFGSAKGMCGGFNERVATFALERLRARSAAGGPGTVMLVGTRLEGRLTDAGFAPSALFPVPNAIAGITLVVNGLLLKLEELRRQGGVNRFFLVHHRPVSNTNYEPRELQLLPVDPGWLQDLRVKEWPSRCLPTFTMDERALTSALIREQLFIMLYRAFAESLASEHAHRLIAMEAAEKNIEGHMSSLTARFQHRRQQSITEELLDLVSAFETLTGGG